MRNKEGMYFISFATINWIDAFVRSVYFELISDSLNYCSSEKGMEVFCYVIMPSHIHLIFRDKNQNPSKLLKEFKTFTSKSMRKAIQLNPVESRKDWILDMMRNAGEQNSNVVNFQFWQQNNHPIELWSAKIIDQKVNYIHKNPVKSGFVSRPEYWRYSSAADFCGEVGPVKLAEL